MEAYYKYLLIIMPVESLSPRILVVRYLLFVIFLFEARYILQLKKAKRNNQPNKRYQQCLVYTCNLCLQNSVKTQLTKKYQLNRQHSNFFFNNFCIFFNIFEKKGQRNVYLSFLCIHFKMSLSASRGVTVKHFNSLPFM